MKLITRSDDVASARSANLAIREAFERGILRNASVLACTNLLGHAYECLGSLQGLCIGLHATIACEWLFLDPKVISLTETGRMHPIRYDETSSPRSPREQT